MLAPNSPRLTTLANGLRIVTDSMPGLKTAAIGIWVNVGARAEDEKNNGVAHLWEHMAFKGTDTRSSFDIVAKIEDVGGQLNAYTGREHTAYVARVLEKDVALALDILSDILQNSLLDESELEKERAVVLQEIGQSNDTPDDIIYDHFHAVCYPSHGLGRSILGTRETVSALSPHDIRQFIDAHYHGGNLIVSASGAVDHDAIVAQCEKLFARLPSRPATQFSPAPFHAGEYREKRPLDQVHLIIGFNGVGFHDPLYYAAQLYSSLMGGGMSSRLFQEIREKRGLVYSIHSFPLSFEDGGLFGVYAGTGEAEVKTLMPVLMDEIAKSADLLPDAEIARAAAQVKAAFLMGLENPMGRAELWASHLLTYNALVPVETIMQRIDAVSARDIQTLVRRMLKSGLSVAALGPLTQLESYAETVARLA